MTDSNKNYTEIQVLKTRVNNIEALTKLVLAVSGTNLLGIVITILAIIITGQQ